MAYIPIPLDEQDKEMRDNENDIAAADYSRYDQHFELVDPMIDIDEDEHVVMGFAIRGADRAGFLIDLRRLVSRYGVSYGELSEADAGDSSLKSALRKAKSPGSPENDVIDL